MTYRRVHALSTPAKKFLEKPRGDSLYRKHKNPFLKGAKQHHLEFFLNRGLLYRFQHLFRNHKDVVTTVFKWKFWKHFSKFNIYIYLFLKIICYYINCVLNQY